MIPIIKNIAVLDGLGRTLDPTYEKRAKGLVKHGRARWINSNTIVLACPPSDRKGDLQMDNQIMEPVAGRTPDFAYIMEKIDEVIAGNAHLEQAVGLLKDFEINTSANGGFGDQGRAEAIREIVKAREETNRQILTILNRMLDSLLPDAQGCKSQGELELEQARIKQYAGLMEKAVENMDMDNPENVRVFMEKAAGIFNPE